MKHYDAIVIGSGGGTKLVTPVANMGKKVAIIEKGPLGGTCLNRGCLPSKMLLHTAQLASLLKDSDRFQLHVNGNFKVDFPGLVHRVATTIDADSNSIAPIYEKHPNIDFYHGEARFIDDKAVQVGEKALTADKFFIAVGARAAVPKIPGLADVPYMTYEQALRCETQPKNLIVIGGGYIATELGYFFAALGSKTEFLVRSQLLKNEDEDIREAFQQAFSKHVTLRLKCDFQEVNHDNGTFSVRYLDGDGNEHTAEGDALLVATGIQPWTDSLGLENTSIQCNDKGFIEVNDHLQTAQKNAWAFGDCVGHYLFRHTANFEGEYLFRTLFESPSDEPICYKAIPHAVFSSPEIAGVGKTEKELQEEGIEYFIGKNEYKDSGRGMALMPEVGFVKLLFETNSEKLLGAQIIGEEASNMIHMLIAFMNMDATLSDLLKMIYIHPALPEIVRNAARNAKKTLSS